MIRNTIIAFFILAIQNISVSQEIILSLPNLKIDENGNFESDKYDPINLYASKIVGKPRYYAKEKVNLRTGVGNDAPILAFIDKYEYVFVVNETVGNNFYSPVSGWWLVYYVTGKKFGWVRNSFLVSDPLK